MFCHLWEGGIETDAEKTQIQEDSHIELRSKMILHLALGQERLTITLPRT